MTDTPPRLVPYVPGPFDQPAPRPDVPPAESTPAKKPRRTGLIAATAVLATAVVALTAAVVVLAGRSPAPAVVAAASSAPVGTLTATAAWSPPPPRDISVKFGDTLTMSDSAGGEIHYTVAADKIYTKTKYGTKPEKGAFYGVKVTVEVISGSTYVCACDFALIAADGTAYAGDSVSVNGGLDAEDVNRGQKTVGIVVFDIPNGAQAGGKIELREGRTSQNQGFWMIP